MAASPSQPPGSSSNNGNRVPVVQNLDQDPPSEAYKQYSVAYSSANNGPNSWRNYYCWLEIYAYLFYVIYAGVLLFASVSYLKPLNITNWYALQCIFPVAFISTIFFVGPPPQSIKQLQLTRHTVHKVFTLITAGACIGAGIAFIIVQIVYAASDSCSSDPNSLCQGHLAAFVFLLFLCTILVAIEVLTLVTVFMSWIHQKNKKINN